MQNCQSCVHLIVLIREKKMNENSFKSMLNEPRRKLKAPKQENAWARHNDSDRC